MKKCIVWGGEVKELGSSFGASLIYVNPPPPLERLSPQHPLNEYIPGAQNLLRTCNKISPKLTNQQLKLNDKRTRKMKTNTSIISFSFPYKRKRNEKRGDISRNLQSLLKL